MHSAHVKICIINKLCYIAVLQNYRFDSFVIKTNQFTSSFWKPVQILDQLTGLLN